jgi:hypothetical protein
MAFNYLNGVQVGNENWDGGNPNYGAGPRYAWKLWFLWLKKVVGWSQVDINGSRWDNAVESGTNGATDATLTYKFTSSGASFTSNCAAGDQLMIAPTSPPATSGGFSDATRNGFYWINQVVDDETLYVDTWRGVHTDGLPLSESGLNYEVHRFRTGGTYLPQNDDFWVLAGTGTGGDFHMYLLNDSVQNYAYSQIWVSPWDDWDAGTHAWKSPARYTSKSNYNNDPHTDKCLCYGFADLTHCFFYYRGYDYNWAAKLPQWFYVGDIEPFNPTDDPRPVVLNTGHTGNTTVTNTYTYMYDKVRMVSHDLTQQTAGLLKMSLYIDSSTGILDGTTRASSRFSGKYYHTPLVVVEDTTGKTEVRGRLKNCYFTHDNGPRIFTPVGTSLDLLRLSNVSIKWNGSKQFYVIA